MYKAIVILLLFFSCTNKKVEIPKQKLLFIDSLNKIQERSIAIKDTARNKRFDCLPWVTKVNGNRIYFYDSLGKIIQVEEKHSDGKMNEFCRIYLIKNKISVIEMEGDFGDLKVTYMMLYYFDDTKTLFKIENGNAIKNLNSCVVSINQELEKSEHVKK